MARIPYTVVEEMNFSQGIDARSSENQIPESYVKDLLNGDIVEKRAKKRKGYQGYAGNIPVRVTQVDYNNSTGQICFTLDKATNLQTAVDLSAVRSTPLVVYGKSSVFTTGQGPFTTDGDTVKYYASFEIPLRKTLVAPSGSTVIPGDEHALGTDNIILNTVNSTSMFSRDYEGIGLDNISIDSSNYAVTLGYSNLQNNLSTFTYYLNGDTETGTVYNSGNTAHAGNGLETVSIPASTHNLSNYNIIVTVLQDNGTSVEYVQPDSIFISPTGTVSVGVVNETGISTDYRYILRACTPSNLTSGVVGPTSSNTITLNNIESPWIFTGIYLDDPANAGSLELVEPDSISYNDTTKNLTVTFVNNDAVARNFRIFYEFGDIRSNQLCVSDPTVTVIGTDETPQLTIWGLDHADIYGDTQLDRNGWVNHIDSYRRSGEQRMVAGLGGNLFTAKTIEEVGNSHLLPTLFPRLSGRVDANSVLGPLFWDDGDTAQRTRGYITSTSSGTHWAAVTSVQYDTGNTWTKYTLSLPNKTILDSTGAPTTLPSVISVASDLEDWLTVNKMSYSRHNGTFRIRQIQDGVDEIYIWVENSRIISTDYDDMNTGGRAGVFTDQLELDSASEFLIADIVKSTAISDTFVLEVKGSLSSTIVMDGLVDRLDLPGGVIVVGSRTSSVIPMRIGVPDQTASVENLVRGDMLSYTDISRLLRIKSINSDATNRNVTIDISSGVGTITLLSGNTDVISTNSKLLLVNASDVSGVIQVNDLLSDTMFEFDATGMDDVTGLSGVLVGATIEIDEELSFMDSEGDTLSLSVEERWIPVEAPEDSYNLTPATYISHLDANQYGNQAFLRSTMVSDNLYLTDYDNEVYKFDGTNLYRAGLIPWQPGLFMTLETGATAEIVVGLRSIAYSAKVSAEGKLQVTAATQRSIPAGSSIRLSGSSETYTVSGFVDDGTNFYVLMDRALDSSVSASGTIAEIGTYRYYFRLNAVDANNNIIASAVTSREDFSVEITENTAIQLKLVGMPAWDVYDYDRLEVEIYRTKLNTAAPFYKVTTLQMTFDNDNGYILYTDTFSDDDLTDLDAVNTALKGTELGTRWTDPTRAKYVTSIGNRLILANVRGYPELDIQYTGTGDLTNSVLSGDIVTFRRNTELTGTTPDMVDIMGYEYTLTNTAGTVTGITGTVGTSFEVTTSAAHGLVAGDWVYLLYSTVASTARPLTYSGWWQVNSVGSTTTFTVKSESSEAGAATSFPTKWLVSASDKKRVPVPLGIDGNLGMASGNSSLTLFNSARRLSLAINASMRMVDVSISGQEGFVPWLIARGGNDLPPAGRIVVTRPRAEDSSPVVVLDSYSGYNIFINGIRRGPSTETIASTKVYPSRVLMSYENYPEIFDAPGVIIDSESDSAIDVNSADGQEITGIIPFFGEAAFGAAQQSGVLVVFKTNSIYLIDINEKVAGRNPVQRIETEGLGCTAPYSIAVTKNGIMFANESGVYCLRRNNSVQYVGLRLERLWSGTISKNNLDIAQGHHYSVGRQYKLSVPLTTDVDTSTGYVENSSVLTYDHTAEQPTQTGELAGAWSRYDNHAATGWANLRENAYFASTRGRVFSVRMVGDATDYRDDSEAINFQLTTRALDFGNSGIRKVVDKIIAHYRNLESTTNGTSLQTATDLQVEFRDTTGFKIIKPTQTTGMGDIISQDIVTISHNTDRRRGVFFQVRINNSTIDENVELAGVSLVVGGLNSNGIVNAAQTR